MFSNSTFSLDYNTMSNSEIMNLPLEKLSDKGFIFLWILANQVDCCVDILGKWGYQLVDIIVWVKVKDKKIWLSHGYYFMHSYELCLVGYKCPIKEHVEFYSKVSNNLIFAEFRGKSQKPDELYEIIETMMPGSKKIEIFARNNNVRPGWLALGNQLGPQFAKWENTVTCNNCQRSLDFSSKRRYKSKKTANYDLCEKCLTEEKLSTQDFFVLNTMIKEDILHEYHACNMCGVEPIWGVRFKNEDVADFDLCEGRFFR
jgi:N6-adenosine-specific RNA methylase IME4